MSQQAIDQPSMRHPYRSTRTTRQRLGWLLGGAVGVLLLLLLIQGIRIALPLQNAYQDGRQFAQIMRGDLSPESYALAQQSLQASASAIEDAEERFALLTPLLHGLRWLPGVGSDLAALPVLADAGQQLSEVAVSGMAIAEPILLAPKGTSPLTQLPAAYAAAEPEMAAILQKIDAIQQQVQMLDPARLNLLREPVEELQAATSLLAPGLRLSASLPDILGVGETRTYLILAQNNHELRATGGFLTAVGRVSLQDGRVVSIDFMDSYDPSISRTDLPLPQAPQPMQEHMNIGVMLLRDANWSPDFPTTAQIVRTIYSQQTGRVVDGVITIDLQAVELFVKALEPLKMAGVDEPLTGATVLEQLTAFWAAPLESEATLASGDTGWWKQRKDFIPKLVDAVLGRIMRGQFDYLRMLSTMYAALDQRSIQLWFADPALQREVATVGWDGALRPPAEGDFLAIVNTNFGYNKVNAVIEERVAYQVSWPDGPAAPAVATVTMIYKHPFERPGYVCDQTPHYEGSYEEMIARCYFDYVRLYAPAGSELLGVQGLQSETVTSQRGEGGSQLFGGYFILSPGSESTIAFQYRLPAEITPANYHLTVRRQAGTPPLPFQADIDQRFVETTIESGLFTWP
ncbi:MAG: DUF4012 domain-containing protein [Caldilineaceae bacterium]|nr:DUF4012 domain-containing protein [Caldilineaceae bacterium]